LTIQRPNGILWKKHDDLTGFKDSGIQGFNGSRKKNAFLFLRVLKGNNIKKELVAYKNISRKKDFIFEEIY
jgi:hypothetical protein